MNFREAAIKVLTENKKPLHYKKITSIAVKNKLLDFLGATPEKRMLDSLKLEVKKKDSKVLVVRPGFFILKDYHNKNLKKKSEKPTKRLEKIKEKKKKDEDTFDEIRNIAEYSKQIYSKQYFSNNESDDETSFKLKDKNDIPEAVLNYILKKKKVRYYSLQEILHIIDKEKIFDISEIIPDELMSIFENYNRKNDDKFLINDNKMVPYSLLESKDLSQNTAKIFEDLKNRDNLINKEIINWFNRLNFGQFKKFSEIFLKSLDLYGMKPIKGISGYYFLSKKLGLSVINFILYLKKGKEEVNKQNIIEARGVLSRFGYGNLIIMTSSKFDNSAIEETKLNGTNIILMDKYFIFDMMKEKEVGITKNNGIYNIDYDFFLNL